MYEKIIQEVFRPEERFDKTRLYRTIESLTNDGEFIFYSQFKLIIICNGLSKEDLDNDVKNNLQEADCEDSYRWNDGDSKVQLTEFDGKPAISIVLTRTW